MVYTQIQNTLRKWSLLFIVASNIYLLINLTKDAKDLYSENIKS